LVYQIKIFTVYIKNYVENQNEKLLVEGREDLENKNGNVAVNRTFEEILLLHINGQLHSPISFHIHMENYFVHSCR